jgi:hypothetical protein
MKKIILVLALLSTNLYAHEGNNVEILGYHEDSIVLFIDGHIWIASKLEHSPYCKCDKNGITNFAEIDAMNNH